MKALLLLPLAAAALRVPPPRPANHDFASPRAWDSAYAELRPDQEGEWLMQYDGQLQQALATRLSALDRHAPILELGCGNSDLAARLVLDEGFLSVVATDASKTAVEHARLRYAGIADRLTFDVADAKRLNSFRQPFAAIIDKGTLDAICSGEGFDCEARTVASSIARALRPGGVWCSVSLMPPEVIGPHLASECWTFESEPLASAIGGSSGGSGCHLHTCTRHAQ